MDLLCVYINGPVSSSSFFPWRGSGGGGGLPHPALCTPVPSPLPHRQKGRQTATATDTVADANADADRLCWTILLGLYRCLSRTPPQVPLVAHAQSSQQRPTVPSRTSPSCTTGSSRTCFPTPSQQRRCRTGERPRDCPP